MEIKDLIATAKNLEERVEKAEAKQKKTDEERETVLSQGGYKPVGQSASSDESKCLRYFGVPHVRKLLEVNVGDPKFSRVPEELKHLVLSLKQDIDISRMTQQIVMGEPCDRAGNRDGNDFVAGHVKGVLDGNYYGKHVLTPRLKAFGTGVAGEGSEWVPTALASQYIEEFELSREVAKMFRSFNMPTNPYELPVQEDITIARIQAEGGVISGANYKTDKLVFSATKLAEFMILPEELNEDSAPNILALTRSEVVEASGRAIEQTIIDGDVTGPHQDSDVLAADDARKAWNGLRKLALDNSATIGFGNAAATLANMRSCRTLMDKHGVNVRNLAWVVSPKIYNQLIALDEVTTVEKFGPQATILKGALSSLDGIPIVISEFMRDDLNASGVHDGITVDRSQVLLVNQSRFMLGVRRPIRVRAVMDPTPPNDRWLMVSWWRGDFQGMEQDAGEKSVVYGINLA